MKPWKLLVILVFCLVVRGFTSAILSSYFDPYYLDLGAQTAMNLGIIALCLQEFQISRRDVKAIVGMFTWAGVLGAAGLALVVLMFTFGESAVSTLILAHFNPKWVYRLGNFHSQALPSHPFFSIHVLSFLVAFSILPAVAEEFFFRGLLFPAFLQNHTCIGSALRCSIVFVSLHLTKGVYLSTVLFSFLLCLMYLQTGSLWSCVAMHACYNIAAFVNQYYFDFHRIRTIDQIQDLHDWLPELSMLAVSLIALLILMQRYRVLLSCRSVGSYLGAEIT